MNQQNLMPQAAQPVNRITTGQLPIELAELSEEILGANAVNSWNSSNVLPSQIKTKRNGDTYWSGSCSYEGDDAE